MVEAKTMILNGTAATTVSSNEKYQHQIVLLNRTGNDEDLDEVLIFRWDEPTNGVVNMALEHTTSASDNKPSWLSVGFFDAFRNTVPIYDETLGVANGQAVIGTYFFASRAVFKYSLGNPHGAEEATQGGVKLLPDEQQTLTFQNMEQGTVVGLELFRTELMFAKQMDEGDDKEEAVLKPSGDNMLMWAWGPPGMQTLGMHDEAGAFRLDFQGTIQSQPNGAGSSSSSTTIATTEPQPESQQEKGSSINIVNATETFQSIANEGTAAANPYAEFDHQVEVDKNLVFYWSDPTSDGILNGRLEHRAESAATAPSWLSFGFYDVVSNPRPVTSDNFVLTASTAIIGNTWSQDNPQIFTLGVNHQTPGVIQPLPDQSSHLWESSILQFTEQGGVVITALSFQKSMKHPTSSEPPIVAIGENIFLWAMGPPGATSLGMHSEVGALRLDLMVASNSGGESTTSTVKTSVPASSPAVTESTISVIDATEQFEPSEDSRFDFQVQLEQDVMFRWETPDQDTGTFTGRLEHTTTDVAAAPEWLGFGFPNPTDSSTWMLMQNTYAIIGTLPIERVQKYSLGANNSHTTGFLMPLPDEQQTLKATKMAQDHNETEGVYRTSLTFVKLLLEPKSPLEAPIWLDGENRFLWAVGNALTSTPTLGMHRDFGALKVDFAKVTDKASNRPIGQPMTPVATPATSPAPVADSGSDTGEENDSYFAPIVKGQCSSSIFRKGKSIKLTPELEMHWEVNDDSDGSGSSDFGIVPSLTVVLQYSGLAWLGFGISPTSQSHHPMATAMIGIPIMKDSPQLKYNISSTEIGGIKAMEGQTLIESYINQEESEPLTTFRFTKALIDGSNEVKIKTKGLNIFSFAIGHGNSLGFHKHRGSFQMDLSECYNKPPVGSTGSAYSKEEESSKAKGALIAHAVMAAIAWGFAMPAAVGMAWFRQLIPTTWIYIHVSFNLLTFVLTLLSIFVAIAAVSTRETSYHLTKAHHVVGILLFVGYTFQVCNGFLRPPVQRKEDGTPVERALLSLSKPQSRREWWHLIHRSMGIFMLIVGLFQIASGMTLFDENFQSGRDNFFWYWTYISLFGLLMISLKIWLVIKNKKARGTSGPWVEDRASTSVGIDNNMVDSDPDGMNMEDDCVVLEIPSRTGESTVIRGARRVSNRIEDTRDRDDSDNMTVEIT